MNAVNKSIAKLNISIVKYLRKTEKLVLIIKIK